MNGLVTAAVNFIFSTKHFLNRWKDSLALNKQGLENLNHYGFLTSNDIIVAQPDDRFTIKIPLL